LKKPISILGAPTNDLPNLIPIDSHINTSLEIVKAIFVAHKSNKSGKMLGYKRLLATQAEVYPILLYGVGVTGYEWVLDALYPLVAEGLPLKADYGRDYPRIS
jgi:hypothetical protein